MGLKHENGLPVLVVKWHIEDIQEAAKMLGKTISPKDAGTFIEQNASVLENSMVDFGWDALKSLL